jgi:hypothetical protein
LGERKQADNGAQRQKPGSVCHRFLLDGDATREFARIPRARFAVLVRREKASFLDVSSCAKSNPDAMLGGPFSPRLADPDRG